MPTIKLPTVKSPFSSKSDDQKAVALTPAPTLKSTPAPTHPAPQGPALAVSPIPSTVAQTPAAPVSHLGEAAARPASREGDALSELAFTFYSQGKLPEAEAAMLKAVSLRPYDKGLRNNLGVIYSHQGRPHEALEQFRLAVGEADACANVGEILAARNDKAGAKDYLQRALAADPGHARAKQGLASLDAQMATNPAAPILR